MTLLWLSYDSPVDPVATPVIAPVVAPVVAPVAPVAPAAFLVLPTQLPTLNFSSLMNECE